MDILTVADREWTLNEIRNTLKELDKERFVKRSSYEDVAVLENAIHELRCVERKLIARKETEIISQLKSAAQALSDHSKGLRVNIAKMNRISKMVDKIEGVAKRVAEIMKEFNKWH